MLIQFKLKNFLSFKDETVISLEAENIKENIKSTFPKNKTKYLKSIAIFGANDSGKTNLFKAMDFFKYFIINSYKNSLSDTKIDIQPFKFNSSTIKEPSLLEITFVNQNNIQYRYGFLADKDKIFEEWLYVVRQTQKSREKEFFTRKLNVVKYGASYNKKVYTSSRSIKSNVLLLTKLGLEIDEIQNEIINWISRNLNIIKGYDKSYGGYTRNRLEKDQKFKEKVVAYFKSVGISVDDLTFHKHLIEDSNEIPPIILNLVKDNKLHGVERINIVTTHKVFDQNRKQIGYINLDLDKDESLGTNQFFNLLGPIIDTIEFGKTLVVDELENSLHPNLLKFIVDIFNSGINRNNAQLIFTTHNISLLDKDEIGDNILRRDQIRFVEMNEFGESQFYSLTGFKEKGKSIRKDENYLKNYLLGKYGAVPFIDEYMHEQD